MVAARLAQWFATATTFSGDARHAPNRRHRKGGLGMTDLHVVTLGVRQRRRQLISPRSCSIITTKDHVRQSEL